MSEPTWSESYKREYVLVDDMVDHGAFPEGGFLSYLC